MKNEKLEVCVNESFSQDRKQQVLSIAQQNGFDAYFRVRSRYETTQVNYAWNDNASIGNTHEGRILVKNVIAEIEKV